MQHDWVYAQDTDPDASPLRQCRLCSEWQDVAGFYDSECKPCIICQQVHTCDERRLPDGDCECCWLASK